MIDKNLIDVSQVFNLYLTFGGDAARTSVAANVPRETVVELARLEGWDAKVADLAVLKEASSGDVVVAMNRAVNFAQASRLRKLVDMVVSELITKSPEELVDALSTKRYDSETGKVVSSSFSARSLTDLVKAGEAAELMTQRALGDTVAERPEGSNDKKGSSIALMVQQAMSGAAMAGADPMPALRKLTNKPADEVHTSPVS